MHVLNFYDYPSNQISSRAVEMVTEMGTSYSHDHFKMAQRNSLKLYRIPESLTSMISQSIDGGRG